MTRNKILDALDVFADDIWSAMGRENESKFEAAYRRRDTVILGSIVKQAIDNCLADVLDEDELTDRCERLHKINREARARDDQDRRAGIVDDARKAGL